MSPISVAFVSRHQMSADAYAFCLSADPELISLPFHATVPDVIDQIRREHPDVVVIEYDERWADIWRIVVESRRASATRKLIVLAAEPSHDLLSRAMRSGADGVVSKDGPVSMLVDAVKRAHEGTPLHSPACLAKLLNLAERKRGDGGSWHALAPRELSVLQSIADGRTVAETAGRLGISAHTVRTHIKRILIKLNVRTKTDAVVVGVRHGFISIAY